MRKMCYQRWSSRVFVPVSAGVIFVLLRAPRVADATAEGDAESRRPKSAQRACDTPIPGISATRIPGTAIPTAIPNRNPQQDPAPDDDWRLEEPLLDDGMSDAPFRGPSTNSAIGLGTSKHRIEQELRP